MRSRSCRAPDWTTRVMYQCPCGDQPVMIPPYRRSQTYLDGAYWCSTVMALLNFDGTVKYVWNPFSLQQLKDMLQGKLDIYLECVASKNDNTCEAPTDPVFQKQQIPMLSVYQRCLSNYQEMTWDQGAFVMFNTTLQARLRLDSIMPSSIPDKFNVSNCLLQQKRLGFDNTGCLNDYFLQGTQPVDYFEYSNITDAQTPDSSVVDACLAFSGPSALPDPRVSAPFLACLENSVNRSGCDIPHMLWSGRSSNKVPVATQHTLNISNMDKKRQLAEGEMAAVQAQVLSTLDQLLQEWSGPDAGSGLKITLFSSEGAPV